MARHIDNERGIALVLTLLLMMTMSALAASLLFLAQTETSASMNYRMMSQARYGAEAGMHKAINYLLNSYTPPGGVGDPLANYDMTTSPVTYNGVPVILSANNAVVSNYPVASVKTGFSNAVKGTLPADGVTVAYAPYARLLSMRQINVYGGVQATIQTWQLTSDGSITAARTAQVEVTAVLETQPVAAEMYAAFATNGGCGALNFMGNNTATDSYDSTAALVGGAPVLSASNGNVGTNGNLTEGGGATIKGTLSTPKVGVGNCSNGNVNALSSSGGAMVTGGIVNLPQQVILPVPAAPNPLPPTTGYSGNGQTLLNGASVGDVTVNAHATLTLCQPAQTCTINVNSITLNGNSTLTVAAGATVILNVAGQGATTPIDFTGGTVVNGSFDPSRLQIQYGGTGTIKLNGGAQTSEMIYAPNAAIALSGGNDFYGAVVGATVTDTGGARIHYDRHLTNQFFVVGNPMLTSFSWQKY